MSRSTEIPHGVETLHSLAARLPRVFARLGDPVAHDVKTRFWSERSSSPCLLTSATTISQRKGRVLVELLANETSQQPDTFTCSSDIAAITPDTAVITPDTVAITSDTAAITTDTAAITTGKMKNKPCQSERLRCRIHW